MDIIGNIELNKIDDLKKHYVPLYSGELACGLFGISEDYIENYLSLDQKFLKNRESTFLVRANGDSMNPEVKSGDILIIDKSIKSFDGCIAAVFYNGTPMCKQLVLSKRPYKLRSLNKQYKDIIISESDEVVIFGVVIGLARDLYYL